MMIDVPRTAKELESKIAHLETYNVERIGTVRYGHGRWPVLCVRSRRWETSRQTVLISAGVHGDEPAGVHAALAFLFGNGANEAHEVFQFIVFPCVNPSGFDAHMLATQSGANLNRLFGIESTQPEVRAIENWLQGYGGRFLMTFDLHEVRPDYVGEGFIEKDNPLGAYLYETVNDDSRRLGRAMIDALPSNRPVCNWPTIYDDINDAGVISYPEGCRNQIYAKGTSFDAFLNRRYTGHSFTLETPTGWSMRDRVDTHLTFLNAALSRTMPAIGEANGRRDSPSR
jgi:hypothetical protein